MRITEQQLNWLDGLSCVRLKSDDTHLREVENFVSCKNSGLQEMIQGNAFKEDEKGNTAFYIIKSRCGEILAYFSLKCGLLFDKHGDLEIIDSKKKLSQLLSKRKLLTGNEALASELKTELDREILSLKEQLRQWIEIDENDSIHKRVAHTPIYDFGCTLLCQKVDSLGSGQEKFYNEFNPDLNAI